MATPAEPDRDLYLGIGIGGGAGAGMFLAGLTEQWVFVALGLVVGVLVSAALYRRAAGS